MSYGSLSHIGGETKLKWVYKLEWIIGLQASMCGFTPTPTRAQGGANLGFRGQNPMNSCVGATCGHECRSENLCSGVPHFC